MPDKPRGLIETGAILALLDQDDRWHHPCREALLDLPVPLATSAAVLTELFHLLELHEGPAAWQFLRSGIVRVLPIADEDLPEIEALMDRYRDRLMDSPMPLSSISPAGSRSPRSSQSITATSRPTASKASGAW